MMAPASASTRKASTSTVSPRDRTFPVSTSTSARTPTAISTSTWPPTAATPRRTTDARAGGSSDLPAFSRLLPPSLRHLPRPLLARRHDRVVDAAEDLPFAILANELILVEAGQFGHRAAVGAAHDQQVARARGGAVAVDLDLRVRDEVVALHVDEPRRRVAEQPDQQLLDLLAPAANGVAVAPFAPAREQVGVAVEVLRIDPRRVLDEDALDRQLVLELADAGIGGRRRRRCRRSATGRRRRIGVAKGNLA